MSAWELAKNAAANNDIEQLENLYQTYGDRIRLNNILLVGCRNGYSNIVEWAVEKGADINVNDGECLAVAARNDFREIIEYLMSKNVDLSGLGGITLTEAEIFAGNNERVIWLFENYVDFRNTEFLKAALESKNEEIIKYLFENGVKDKDNSLLLWYIDEGNIEIVPLLLPFIENLDISLIKNTIKNNHDAYLEIIKFLTQSDEAPAGSNIESKKVKEVCMNDQDLSADDLDGSKKFVVFMLEGNTQGYCYTLYELGKILEPENQVYEWQGPPAPYNSGDEANYGADLEKPVYRLPYNGIWVRWETVIEAILLAFNNKENKPNLITLSKKKQSLGSTFGVSQLHGQWGGEWAPVTKIVGSKFVPSNNATPDEREFLYY